MILPKAICVSGAVILSLVVVAIGVVTLIAALALFNLDWLLVKYLRPMLDWLYIWISPWFMVVFLIIYWASRFTPGFYKKCYRFWHKDEVRP